MVVNRDNPGIDVCTCSYANTCPGHGLDEGSSKEP